MKPFNGTVPLPFILVLIAVLLSGLYFVWDRFSGSGNDSADSYAQCVAEGNAVLESYPEQCIDLKTGRHFVNPEPQIRNQ